MINKKEIELPFEYKSKATVGAISKKIHVWTDCKYFYDYMVGFDGICQPKPDIEYGRYIYILDLFESVGETKHHHIIETKSLKEALEIYKEFNK